MLWALLFSLIFGSSNNPMMIPKFHKYAKQHIEDKERLDKVLDYRKQIKKNKKAFHKTEKKQLKTLDALYSDPGIGNDSIYHFYENLLDDKKASLEHEIDLTIEAKSLIREEEWNHIRSSFEEDIRKVLKQQGKHRKKVNKQLERITSSDKMNTITLEPVTEDFSAISINLLQQSLELQLPENTILMEYNCTKDDYLRSIEAFFNLKRQLLEAQLRLRSDLSGQLSGKRLSKPLKRARKVTL